MAVTYILRSINGFLQRTLRLGQSNFHLASVFPQNLMYRGSRKSAFVKKQTQESVGWCVWAITTCCHDLHNPKRFGLTAQWVSAALQREDQTCTRTWRTWPKSYDFADLPPHLKGAKIRWRQFTFSLELTLVFEARDLNSVILQMVRSMIWRNLDEGNSI